MSKENYRVMTWWHRKLEPDEIVLIGKFSTMGEMCPDTWEYEGEQYKYGSLTDIPDKLAGQVATARIYKKIQKWNRHYKQ